MAIQKSLQERSSNSCELCTKSDEQLHAYSVPPKNQGNADEQVVLCSECFRLIESGNFENKHYWRFLEGSIWSEVPSVQVLSYKILGKLAPEEQWAKDAMEAAYLDEALISWAQAEEALEAARVVHKDSYGTVLEAGDSVILTQNLNVKGTNYIAPKGTMVRKIKLVADNADQIEGKINGDTIVILTKYVKKSV